MAELYPELTKQPIKRAVPYYPNVLPYHNWRHARDVILSANILAKVATHPEIIDNKELLLIAAAWHDVDYYKPTTADETKEERSARLARVNLPELSAEQRWIVSDGIIDTTVANTEKSSLFGAVLHVADLGYFAADNHSFMNRLDMIHAEWGHPAWSEVVERTKAFGSHVIIEARKTLTEAASPKIAAAWTEVIEKNLESLEKRPDETVL